MSYRERLKETNRDAKAVFGAGVVGTIVGIAGMAGLLDNIPVVDRFVEDQFNSVDPLADRVLGFIEGFFRGAGDVVNAFGDGINTVGDLAGWIPAVGGFLDEALGALAGAVEFTSGFWYGFASLLDIVQQASGARSMMTAVGFFLGLFMIMLSMYLIFTGITEGEALVPSVYDNDIFFAMTGLIMGIGMMVYGIVPIAGAVMIAGIGVISMFFGIQADEAELVVMGVFASLFGFPMVLAELGLSPLLIGFLTVVGIVVLVYGSDQLENRFAPRIAGGR